MRVLEVFSKQAPFKTYFLFRKCLSSVFDDVKLLG